MTRELVDLRVGPVEAGERQLESAARAWAASDDRSAQIASYMDLTGCSELRAAEMADASRGVEFREERDRQAADETRRDVLEGQNWMAARQVAMDNLRAGLPEDATPIDRARLGMIPGVSDEPSRDPRAPYGSASNPAFFVETSSGPVDIGYRAAQDAQRSFGQSVDGARLARHREQSRDSYMLIQRSQYRSRRAHRAAAAEMASAAERYETGTGWPGELVR